MITQGYSSAITRLDLIKAAAVVLFLIDMIGYTFFPGGPNDPSGMPHLWIRAVGQLYVPIMFFLIGYSQNRAIPQGLWSGALYLLALSFVAGMYIFPLNVLFTIIALRLLIDRLGIFTFQRWENLGIVAFACAIMFFHSNLLIEYGTLAPLFALVGYGVRHHGKDYGLLRDQRLLSVMFWVAILIYGLTEQVFFGFGKTQMAFQMVAATIIIHKLMKSDLHAPVPPSLQFGALATKAVQIMGRQTLQIYIVAITVFVLLGWLGGYGLQIYGWFDWEWTVMESFAKLYGQNSQ